MSSKSMIYTLRHLKGNPKVSILTEPLWYIPFSLYIPYVTIYMRALGISQIQIGYILTIGMISQVIFSLLGGVITDKFGRRKTTFWFDVISWVIPTFIWAISQNVWYFIIAAIINGAWRVTAISWTCLFVEDAEESQLVSLFSWIHIAGMLSAFFAPIAGILISRYTLIPTVRGIYIFTSISMMIKFLLLYRFSTETRTGLERMAATAGQSWGSMLTGYLDTIKHILTSKKTMFVVTMMLLIGIVTTVTGSFWGVIVTERLNIDPSYVALITTVKSLVMIAFYFIVLPRVKVALFQKPLLIGLLVFMGAQVLLVSGSENGLLIVVLSVIMEGVSLSLVNPLLDSLQVTMINRQERARIVAVLYTVVILFTAPFGTLAGYLSEMDQRLPFVMNMAVLFVAIVMLLAYGQRHTESNEA